MDKRWPLEVWLELDLGPRCRWRSGSCRRRAAASRHQAYLSHWFHEIGWREQVTLSLPKLCCIPCTWGLSSVLVPVLSARAHTFSPLSLHPPSRAVRNYWDWLWLSLVYELFIAVLCWQLVSYFAFGGGHGGHGLITRMWKLEASLGLIYSLSFSNRGLMRLEEEGTFPRPQRKPGARLPFLPRSVFSWAWREVGFREQQVVPFLALCSFSLAPSVTEAEQKPDHIQFLSRLSFSMHGWRNLFFSFFTRGGKTGWSGADWGRNWVKSVWGLIGRPLEKEMATHSSVLAWRIPGMGEPRGLTSMGSHRVGRNWSGLAAGRPWVSESFWFRWGVSKCFC